MILNSLCFRDVISLLRFSFFFLLHGKEKTNGSVRRETHTFAYFSPRVNSHDRRRRRHLSRLFFSPVFLRIVGLKRKRSGRVIVIRHPGAANGEIKFFSSQAFETHAGLKTSIAAFPVFSSFHLLFFSIPQRQRCPAGSS